VPEELVDEISENRTHVKQIGVEWGIKQCRDLLNNGVQCVHFYIMSDAGAVVKVIESL
jgi:methylenetetrahydrofolate reductase (NADPH)